jgi:hypothetical protein
MVEQKLEFSSQQLRQEEERMKQSVSKLNRLEEKLVSLRITQQEVAEHELILTLTEIFNEVSAHQTLLSRVVSNAQTKDIFSIREWEDLLEQIEANLPHNLKIPSRKLSVILSMAENYRFHITSNHTIQIKFVIPLLRKDSFQSLLIFEIPDENNTIPMIESSQIAINKRKALYFYPEHSVEIFGAINMIHQNKFYSLVNKPTCVTSQFTKAPSLCSIRTMGRDEETLTPLPAPNTWFYRTTQPQNIEVICSHSSEVASAKAGLIKIEPGCSIQTKTTRVFATNHRSLTQHPSASVPIHYQAFPEWNSQNQTVSESDAALTKQINTRTNTNHWWILLIFLCLLSLILICCSAGSQTEANQLETTDIPLQSLPSHQSAQGPHDEDDPNSHFCHQSTQGPHDEDDPISHCCQQLNE